MTKAPLNTATLLRRAMNRLGVRRGKVSGTPLTESMTDEDRRILERIRPYTMTSPLRIQALLDAVAYVSARGIEGAFAECGVWRGGSVMAMILKLQQLGAAPRDIYLYDTFEGMTAPTERDTSRFHAPALETWRAAQAHATRAWDYFFKPEIFNEELVREQLLATGYPAAHLHFVKGPVEQTLPAIAPERLALLRLDTDWYDSTRHELECLYPRLSTAGVLIIDDYGHWEGARQAVDEYFASGRVPPAMLCRVDYAGRLVIKA